MASVLSQNPFFADRAPVPASEVRIESIGVSPLDQRRVDVAADLTPCMERLDPEVLDSFVWIKQIKELNCSEICQSLSTMISNPTWKRMMPFHQLWIRCLGGCSL
jgi:hypothetical protein